METVISIKRLVQEAKKREIDLGKGNPYNRLRYYTKIGWLPHMIRKNGKGHYPIETLEQLALIEKLKKKALTNQEITAELNKRNKVKSMQKIIRSSEIRLKLVTYSTFFILLIILADEFDIINIGNSKNYITTQSITQVPNQITDSGTAFVPKNKSRVFVKAKTITNSSKVYITLNDNPSPATRYWVGSKIDFDGFYVEIDTPSAKNIEFSWWITQ
jgi:DNA-binding transcriptional MerR regulator